MAQTPRIDRGDTSDGLGKVGKLMATMTLSLGGGVVEWFPRGKREKMGNSVVVGSRSPFVVIFF